MPGLHPLSSRGEGGRGRGRGGGRGEEAEGGRRGVLRAGCRRDRGETTAAAAAAAGREGRGGWRDACSRFPYRRGTVVCAFMKICQTHPRPLPHPPSSTPRILRRSPPLPPLPLASIRPAPFRRRGPRVMIALVHLEDSKSRNCCLSSFPFPMRPMHHRETRYLDPRSSEGGGRGSKTEKELDRRERVSASLDPERNLIRRLHLEARPRKFLEDCPRRALEMNSK